MSDIKSREDEIKDLQDQLSRSRNDVERAELDGKIKKIKQEIEEEKFPKNSEIVTQKEVAARADHKEMKSHSRGDIVNAGSTFTSIL